MRGNGRNESRDQKVNNPEEDYGYGYGYAYGYYPWWRPYNSWYNYYPYGRDFNSNVSFVSGRRSLRNMNSN